MNHGDEIVERPLGAMKIVALIFIGDLVIIACIVAAVIVHFVR